MKKIIITENQLKNVIKTIINETPTEVNTDRVQNFIEILKDSKVFDAQLVNKYIIRINKEPFDDVLKDFVKQFGYNMDLVNKIINKKRKDLVVTQNKNPFIVTKGRKSNAVDTSFDKELDLNYYLNLLDEETDNEEDKEHLIRNIFNENFFAKLNLVLSDFLPKFNHWKEEYQSTKQQVPFGNLTLDDLDNFSDPFTDEKLTYTKDQLKNPKEKPILKNGVIFKNYYTYSLAEQLIYIKNVLKNIMKYPKKRHQLTDHTVRSVNRYLSFKNIDPELKRKTKKR